MDPAYHNALQRRSRLLKELEKVEQFIALYEEFSGENASADPGVQNENISPVDPQKSQSFEAALDIVAGEVARRVTGNPKPAAVIRASLEILEAKGHPLTRRQLMAELVKRDLVIRGANPMKVLGTNLWRAQDQIVSLEGHGYWPRDLAYGPANYYPKDGRLF